MTKDRNLTGRAMTLPGGAALGALYAFVWTLVSSGILAWLVHSQRIPETAIGYGSMVILLTASVLGAWIAYKKVKRQRAAVSAAAGGMYFIMLLALTALFFGGQYTGVGVTALLILGGSAAAALLGMGKGRSSNPKIRKIRH